MGTHVALITGSSRGIGRGIALQLAAKGWAVVVNYSSNKEAALEVESAIEALGSVAFIVQGDVSDPTDRDRLVASTLERFGRIDLLVNNAGVGPSQRVDMLHVGEESYDRVMGINLKGPFFLTQLVAREMILLVESGQVKSPKIVNIGSISAYTSSPSRAEYCLSKAGITMMTRLWADRLAAHGINVYEVSPGIIDTDMTAVVKEKYDQLILTEGITPIRRWGKPEDIGKAVVAIAEGYFPFSTGEVINVDGGFHIARL